MPDTTLDFSNSDFKSDPKTIEKALIVFGPWIKYLISKIVGKLPPHIDFDELISVGIIGLIDAIEKFDPGKKVRFKTYAEFRINGAILDEINSRNWIPRSVRRKIRKIEDATARLENMLGRTPDDKELAEELKVDQKTLNKLLSETAPVLLLCLDDLGEDGDEETKRDFFEFIIQKNIDLPGNLIFIKDLVIKALESLPENELLVVSMYYFDELTMKEIGQTLKLTESRVSQLHTKAILRIRVKLKGIIEEEKGNSFYLHLVEKLEKFKIKA